MKEFVKKLKKLFFDTPIQDFEAKNESLPKSENPNEIGVQGKKNNNKYTVY